jgi:hypothetical protein
MELARAHGVGPMAAETAGSVNVRCRRFALSRSAATAAGAPGAGTRANTALRSFPPIGPRICRPGHNGALATRRHCPDGRAAHPAGHIVSDVVRTAPAQNSIAIARADRVGTRAAPAATRSPTPRQRRRPI